MKGLQFIAAVLASALAAAVPSFAVAQQGSAKVPRIAYLDTTSAPTAPANLAAFIDGLAELGYVNGKNILIEPFVAPTPDDLPAYAAKAVASNPDVLLTMATGTLGTEALSKATSTIPIVAYTDLLAGGFVTSLAHPGGNITGVSTLGSELAGKRVELLRDAVPALKSIAILDISENPAIARETAAAAAAASALGIRADLVELDQGSDLTPQFQRVVADHAQSVYVPVATYFNANRAVLCGLLQSADLASVFANPVTPNCGVLGYGPDTPAQFRRVASYVDAILKGAKPADLPVEQSPVLDFVVNIATAKALGLTVPPSILAQATQVIE